MSEPGLAAPGHTDVAAFVPSLLPPELAARENLDEPAHVHEKFCAYAEVLLHELCATLEELFSWKDQMIALHTLPTNITVGLLTILGQLMRWFAPWGADQRPITKSRLRGATLQMASLVRAHVRGAMRDEDLNRLKLQLTRRACEVAMEQARATEARRKLRATTAQLFHLQSEARVHRWYRVLSKLKRREQRAESRREARQLRGHIDALRTTMKRQRDRLRALQYIERAVGEQQLRDGGRSEGQTAQQRSAADSSSAVPALAAPKVGEQLSDLRAQGRLPGHVLRFVDRAPEHHAGAQPRSPRMQRASRAKRVRGARPRRGGKRGQASGGVVAGAGAEPLGPEAEGSALLHEVAPVPADAGSQRSRAGSHASAADSDYWSASPAPPPGGSPLAPLESGPSWMWAEAEGGAGGDEGVSATRPANVASDEAGKERRPAVPHDGCTPENGDDGAGEEGAGSTEAERTERRSRYRERALSGAAAPPRERSGDCGGQDDSESAHSCFGGEGDEVGGGGSYSVRPHTVHGTVKAEAKRPRTVVHSTVGGSVSSLATSGCDGSQAGGGQEADGDGDAAHAGREASSGRGLTRQRAVVFATASPEEAQGTGRGCGGEAEEDAAAAAPSPQRLDTDAAAATENDAFSEVATRQGGRSPSEGGVRRLGDAGPEADGDGLATVVGSVRAPGSSVTDAAVASAWDRLGHEAASFAFTASESGISLAPSDLSRGRAASRARPASPRFPLGDADEMSTVPSSRASEQGGQGAASPSERGADEGQGSSRGGGSQATGSSRRAWLRALAQCAVAMEDAGMAVPADARLLLGWPDTADEDAAAGRPRSRARAAAGSSRASCHPDGRSGADLHTPTAEDIWAGEAGSGRGRWHTVRVEQEEVTRRGRDEAAAETPAGWESRTPPPHGPRMRLPLLTVTPRDAPEEASGGAAPRAVGDDGPRSARARLSGPAGGRQWGDPPLDLGRPPPRDALRRRRRVAPALPPERGGDGSGKGDRIVFSVAMGPRGRAGRVGRPPQPAPARRRHVQVRADERAPRFVRGVGQRVFPIGGVVPVPSSANRSSVYE